jgi:hypothetical protein
MGQEGGMRVTSYAPENAKNVKEWTLTFPSELPLWELESQMDISNLQSAIEGVKTHRLEELFISLKIYWNLDV